MYFSSSTREKASSNVLTDNLPSKDSMKSQSVQPKSADAQDSLPPVSRTTRWLSPASHMKRPRLLILFMEITIRPKPSGSAYFLHAMITFRYLFLINLSLEDITEKIYGREKFFSCTKSE